PSLLLLQKDSGNQDSPPPPNPHPSSPEEARHIYANDRPLNLPYQYAVIPAISSLSWFTTVVPLLLVLTMTGAKDASDDINRHRSDKQVNNRRVDILIDGELQSEKWMNVQVGDIIKLENNQFVTADLLLLTSSENLNLVYIETAELDG
ncbi:hypothetical protein CRUP_038474, partial [Coryphaenoides rupestris]